MTENEKKTKWRRDNPDKMTVYRRTWVVKNRPKVREQKRLWRINNLAASKEQERTARLKNLDKYLAAERKWSAANRDKLNGATEKWRKANPERYQLLRKKWKAARRARLRTATIGDLTDIHKIYARCEELRKWFSVVVDHIIPLAKGGTHEASNLQIIYDFENQRKNARLDYKPRVVFV